MDGSETLITYRYVRIALVSLAVAIGIALLEQRLDAHSFQGSISSYYYSPARGVFVAALFGIGVCLICVRGGTVLEDALLNVAGMLSFVVALVPTPPDKHDPNFHVLSTDRAAAIRNNFPALLWLGVFAFALVLVVLVVRLVKGGNGTSSGLAGWYSAPVAGALLVAAYVWHHHWPENFLAWAHLTAAISMFAMIGVVAISDGIVTALEPKTRLRGWLYIAIGALMGLGGGGIFLANRSHPWHQALLDAEALLIALFALFWAAQTIDLWNYTSRKQAILARRQPPQ
jgi:hypothetical protein